MPYIEFSNIQTFDLISRDRSSQSDPYVKFLFNGQSLGQTKPKRNAQKRVSWDPSIGKFINVSTANATLRVEVWDYDRGSHDELGHAEFKLLVSEDGAFDMDLALELSSGNPLQSKVKFYVSVDADEDEGGVVPIPSSPSSQVLVRKEIRDLKYEEGQRFVKALQTMMQNRVNTVTGQEIPESSPFLECAQIHGWAGQSGIKYYNLPKADGSPTLGIGSEEFNSYPNGSNFFYCTHGQETFPGWHRAYLCMFQHYLSDADIANDGDGMLALPYWDVIFHPRKNGEVLPKVIMDAFPNGTSTTQKLLSNPRDADLPNKQTYQRGTLSGRMYREVLYNDGYSIASESSIASKVRSGDPAGRVHDMFNTGVHYRAASSYGGRDSIEGPHGSVHVYCGYPMKDLGTAAFHPLFWLHHNNIDRCYEGYLHTHGVGQQFQQFQQNQRTGTHAADRRDNLYTKPLDPFKAPVSLGQPYGGTNGSAGPFMPDMCKDIKGALGYVYDSLPERAASFLKVLPTLAVFEKVDLNMIPDSVEMYVFLFKPGEPTDVALTDAETLMALPSFAGVGSIFAGNGTQCENCATRDPVDCVVDITEKMKELGLTRDTAVIKVVVEGSFYDLQYLEDTSFPSPVLRGPYFESREETINTSSKDGVDITSLQERLRELGYYSGKVDARFGGKTMAAVKAFQAFVGLVESGEADKETKRLLTKLRYDQEADLLAEGDKATFKSGTTLTYFVGPVPGSLSRPKVMAEISDVLSQWGHVVDITFKRLPEQTCKTKTPDFKILWDKQLKDSKLEFDGPGGRLAQGNKTGIVFDVSEQWLTEGETAEPGDKGFSLKAVFLHEMGHVLGLNHSKKPDDVMSPYYDERKTTLKVNDIARARALYGLPDTKWKSDQVSAWLDKHKVNDALSSALNEAIAAKTDDPLAYMANVLASMAK